MICVILVISLIHLCNEANPEVKICTSSNHASFLVFGVTLRIKMVDIFINLLSILTEKLRMRCQGRSVTNDFVDRTLKPCARTNLTSDKRSHTGG